MPPDTDVTVPPGAAPFSGANDRSTPPVPAITNRIRALLIHIPWYAIEGQVRLSYDARVSRSTISRLLNGRINPSYRLARAVTDALSRRSGIHLDMREVFSTDGSYLTASVCDLMGCRGCFPPEAWNERDDCLKPEWENARPSDWSRYSAAPTVPEIEIINEI